MGKIGRERLQRLIIIIMIAAFPSFVIAGELRVGVISDRPFEIIKSYHPLTQYLASRLRNFDITEGKVVVTQDIREMVQKLRNREVEILFESAFATIEVKEKVGMLPKLLVWKKGVKDYKSLFFVRNDSEIKTLKDLRGKVIVFESPNSTSAYAVPKAELKRMGFAVLPLEAAPRADAINYVFARREINQAFQVLQKKADAGAFNNNDWEEVPAKGREDLRIIHETRPVLRFVASFHSSLPGKLQSAIIDILTDMDKTSEGLQVLQAAQGASKIERLTEDNFRSLDYVRNLIKIIGE